jgi:transposase InsO family protein
VGRSEGTLGDHDRLLGSDGVGLALRHADHRRGSGRDVARSDIPAIWRGMCPRAGDRGSHTPRRSLQSNGLAEAFLCSFKRDYVYQAYLDTVEEVWRQVPAWIDHYN